MHKHLVFKYLPSNWYIGSKKFENSTLLNLVKIILWSILYTLDWMVIRWLIVWQIKLRLMGNYKFVFNCIGIGLLH